MAPDNRVHTGKEMIWGWRQCITGNFVICTLQQILLGWRNQRGEMGGTCNTHGGDEKCIRHFSWKICRKDSWDDDHGDDRIGRTEVGYEGVEGPVLGSCGYSNNYRATWKAGDFWQTEQLLASQERMCSMKLQKQMLRDRSHKSVLQWCRFYNNSRVQGYLEISDDVSVVNI
jgi:hypothetical protein